MELKEVEEVFDREKEICKAIFFTRNSAVTVITWFAIVIFGVIGGSMAWALGAQGTMSRNSNRLDTVEQNQERILIQYSVIDKKLDQIINK